MSTHSYYNKKIPKLMYQKITKIKLINFNKNYKNMYNNKKKKILISMAIDNNLIYPTLVSMISALENNNKNNILIYYLFLSYDFKLKNIYLYESLKNDYQVLIYYFIIPDIFRYFRKWYEITYGIYYKLLIPFLLPNLKRIIFLDGDTLIFDDILEMYNLPFNDNYILGYPFHTAKALDKFKANSTKYINGGVLLINIEKIIKDHKEKELIEFTYSKNKNLVFLEQDSINYVLKPKIGFLPLKYGIYLYGNINNFNINYKNELRVSLNISEINNSINNPSLIHFSGCTPKVWNKNSKHIDGINSVCEKFQKKFYNYANKTKYYKLIYNKYMK